MQPKSNNLFKRLPTWVSITIGVVIGILITSIFRSDVSTAVSLSADSILLSASPIQHYGAAAARQQ